MLKLTRPKLLQNLQTLRRLSRILWVRVALIAILSVLAALSAEPLEQVMPDGSENRFSASTTLPILTILANGMLAVATFSLGVMVSSHRSSADQSTPRIHRLLMEDTTTQSVLATFIGAFVFSLSAIILFNAGYYSESAAVLVFAASIFVVVTVVVSLVRWIGQLTKIGSLEYALDRAEFAAQETLRDMQISPCLGGCSWDLREPEQPDIRAFHASSSGFLSRIDMEKLQSLATKVDGKIYLKRRPGDRVLKGEVLGWTDARIEEKQLTGCFILRASRSVDQDPRYAIIILREAASKALSPGVNDQGTAIEVIARLERLLWDLGADIEASDPTFDRVFVPELPSGTLPIYAFRILARDGAAHTEVLVTLADVVVRLSRRETVLGTKTAKALLKDIQGHGSNSLATDREKDRLMAALEDKEIPIALNSDLVP